MTFEVTDAARRDLARAIRFYNSRPGRYGADVRAEFDRAALAIAATPRGFPPVDDEYPGEEVREYFIARFDQRVVYHIDGEVVRVIAVVHATRAPESWHNRVPPRTDSRTRGPHRDRSSSRRPPLVPATVRGRPRVRRPGRSAGGRSVRRG